MSKIIIRTPVSANQKFIVEHCQSFFSRFKGLMLRKELPAYEGILIDEKKDGIANTTIHMFFMRFDITAVWINSDLKVTDVQYCRCWRPYYAPKQASRYILECHSDRMNDFQIGDQLTFENL